MKKYLRYANWMILAAGTVGFLLLFWLFSGGTDQRGLYPAKHPAWMLVGILTVLAVMATWILVRHAGTNRSYRQNFPASIPAAVGCVVAAIGLLVSGIATLEVAKFLGKLTGWIGILGAAAMLWAGICRFLGRRNPLPVHALPCFFFALQLFVVGQEYGSEPEMYRYLYRFWATVTMVPACYWLWSFDVRMGKRPNCLFWCLVAAYCNLVAIAGSEQQLLHLCMVIWMLTALPRLQYLPKTQRPATQAVTEAEPLPETNPAGSTEVSLFSISEAETEQPAPETNPLAVELPDPDAVLEALLREFGQPEES